MVELIKKYVDNRIQLIKFELFSILANVSATLINSFFILIIALFVLLMFSLALAVWFADLFASYTLGFVLVGGIYVVILLAYLLVSKNAIDKKVKDAIIKAALSGEEELKDINENSYDEETEQYPY